MGQTGLLKDFVDAEITDEDLKASKMPVMLIIRRGLSKARHKYFTFVPEQTLTYINEHLAERVRNGEELDGETPLLGIRP